MVHENLPSHEVIERTQKWVQAAVVGLGLCPFAAPVVLKDKIRFVVCWGESEEDWLEQLMQELEHLQASDVERCETTLMMAPLMLADFDHFNLFLHSANKMIKRRGLAREFQLAHFHPHYCFKGAAPQDPSNNTNKAPYPTLHLLRQSSLERASEMGFEVEDLLRRNQDKLTELGGEGFAELAKAWRSGA
jgi:hypothetical protein